jgi:hypothetical protein
LRGGELLVDWVFSVTYVMILAEGAAQITHARDMSVSMFILLMLVMLVILAESIKSVPEEDGTAAIVTLHARLYSAISYLGS